MSARYPDCFMERIIRPVFAIVLAKTWLKGRVKNRFETVKILRKVQYVE